MQDNNLVGIVEGRIASLVTELEQAGWHVSHVVRAIENALQRHAHHEPEKLRRIREDIPQDFISDGNEG